MLLFYFLMLLTIAFPIHGGLIKDYDDDVGKEWFSKEAEVYFRKRCKNNRRQLRYVLRELKNFNSCFGQLFPNLMEKDEQAAQDNCLDKRYEVMECVEKALELLKPCLPEEENYLPHFVLMSYEGFSKYLCDNAHLLTMRGLVTTNMVTCIDRFTRSRMYHPHYVCYETITFGNRTYDDPISQEDLCQDLNQFYDCFEHQYEKHCPDAPRAWELQAGLLNGLRSPCPEVEAGEEEEEEEDWGEEEEKEDEEDEGEEGEEGEEEEEEEEGEEEGEEENLEDENEPTEEPEEEENGEEAEEEEQEAEEYEWK